ncbi:MAG: DUF433 domain-containing protein [Pyrinomonadaceae bacterium]
MSNHSNLITTDPELLGGTPVFIGTRVPVQNLFDCLADGETVDEFLDQFPTVTREHVLAVMEQAKDRLLIEYESAA